MTAVTSKLMLRKHLKTSEQRAAFFDHRGKTTSLKREIPHRRMNAMRTRRQLYITEIGGCKVDLTQFGKRHHCCEKTIRQLTEQPKVILSRNVQLPENLNSEDAVPDAAYFIECSSVEERTADPHVSIEAQLREMFEEKDDGTAGEMDKAIETEPKPKKTKRAINDLLVKLFGSSLDDLNEHASPEKKKLPSRQSLPVSINLEFTQFRGLAEKVSQKRRSVELVPVSPKVAKVANEMSSLTAVEEVHAFLKVEELYLPRVRMEVAEIRETEEIKQVAIVCPKPEIMTCVRQASVSAVEAIIDLTAEEDVKSEEPFEEKHKIELEIEIKEHPLSMPSLSPILLEVANLRTYRKRCRAKDETFESKVEISDVNGLLRENPSKKRESNPNETADVSQQKPVEKPQQTVAKPVEKPQQTIVRPVEKPQQTIGKPVEKPQQTIVRPVEKPQQTIGKPVEKPQQTIVRPVEKPQQTIGKQVEKPQQTIVRPVEKPQRVVARVVAKPQKTVEKPQRIAAKLVEKLQQTGAKPVEKPQQIVARPVEKPQRIIARVVEMPVEKPQRIVAKPVEKLQQIAAKPREPMQKPPVQVSRDDPFEVRMIVEKQTGLQLPVSVAKPPNQQQIVENPRGTVHWGGGAVQMQRESRNAQPLEKTAEQWQVVPQSALNRLQQMQPPTNGFRRNGGPVNRSPPPYPQGTRSFGEYLRSHLTVDNQRQPVVAPQPQRTLPHLQPLRASLPPQANVRQQTLQIVYISNVDCGLRIFPYVAKFCVWRRHMTSYCEHTRLLFDTPSAKQQNAIVRDSINKLPHAWGCDLINELRTVDVKHFVIADVLNVVAKRMLDGGMNWSAWKVCAQLFRMIESCHDNCVTSFTRRFYRAVQQINVVIEKKSETALPKWTAEQLIELKTQIMHYHQLQKWVDCYLWGVQCVWRAEAMRQRTIQSHRTPVQLPNVPNGLTSIQSEATQSPGLNSIPPNVPNGLTSVQSEATQSPAPTASEPTDSLGETTELDSSDEYEVIDLTWIDDADATEMLEEVTECKIFPFKVEPRENSSPADSGLDSPHEQTETGKNMNCICARQATYLCACKRMAYCGRQCQADDWILHKAHCTFKT